MDELVARVREFIERRNIKAQIIEFDSSTKNSQLAAQVLGCSVGEIAKSIVFTNHQPLIVILSGDRRVDYGRLEKLIGGQVTLADATTVLNSTGYPVGGVPPFAHVNPTRVLIDRSLERFGEVYAAAGTANAILKIRFEDLRVASGAELVDVSS